MRFANRRHGAAAKLLREEDRRLSPARRHHQNIAPAEQYVLRSPSSCGAAHEDPTLAHCIESSPTHRGHVSPAMLAGIQNPCPVGERDINALLPKRRAKLGRKLIQHLLDGRIEEMTEVRVDRFARE